MLQNSNEVEGDIATKIVRTPNNKEEDSTPKNWKSGSSYFNRKRKIMQDKNYEKESIKVSILKIRKEKEEIERDILMLQKKK